MGVFAILAGCGKNDSNNTPDGGTDGKIDNTPMNEDQVLEACVRLHACGIQKHPRTGDCFSDFYNRFVRFGQRALYQSMYRCANAGKGDCKIIRECLGFQGKPQTCGTGYQPRCDGDVAYNCDLLAKWEQGIKCSLGGLKCGLKKAGSQTQAVCGGGTCDEQQFKADCSTDQKLLQCVGGAIEIIDCPEQGLQCRDPKKGVCEGKGRSCRDFSPECRGDSVFRCEQGYEWVRDCSKEFGSKKCDTGLADCVGAGTECNTDSFFDECQGDTLVVCIDGKRRTFDCKGMGFEGCVKEGSFANCKALPVYE
ncbi:MAG: hypothetical protein KC503_46710 [Myxococcales bacterium]|nr:hypothetical protein [Myxococcales bacterium]